MTAHNDESRVKFDGNRRQIPICSEKRVQTKIQDESARHSNVEAGVNCNRIVGLDGLVPPNPFLEAYAASHPP